MPGNNPQLKAVINPTVAPGAETRIQRQGDLLGRTFAEAFKRGASLNPNLPSTSTITAAGATAGSAYAAAFNAAAQVNAPTPNTPNTSGQGSQAGKQYADAFERTVQENLRRALQSLPSANVNISDAAAQQKISELRARMEALGQDDIRLTMDSAAITTEIDKIHVELQALQHQGNIDIDVNLDITSAIAHLATLQAALHTAGQQGGQQGGQSAGSSFAQAFMAQVNTMATTAQQGLGNMMNNLIQPISPATIGSFTMMAAQIALVGAAALALIPVVAVLVAGLGGLLAIGLALGAGVAVLALAFVPLIKQYTELEQKKAAATQASEKLKAAHEQEAQAAEALKNAQENLKRAQDDDREQEANAQAALAKAKANAKDAEATATKKVKDAEASLEQAREEATRAAEAAAQRVAKAKEEEEQAVADANANIKDAEENLAQVIEDNSDSIAAAKQKVKDVEAQNGKDIAAAKADVQTAEKNLQNVEQDGLDLDKKISEQRKQDKKDLDELDLAIKRNALDQADAAQKLQDAQAELSRARGTGDGAAIGAAQRNVDRAQLEVNESKEQGGTLKDERTELAKNGSKELKTLLQQEEEQVDRVAEANKRLAEANTQATQAQIQATKDLQAAKDAEAKAEEDAASREEAAKERVQKAEDAKNKAEQDGRASILAAQQALADQERQNSRATQQAAEAITAAEKDKAATITQGEEQIQAAKDASAKAEKDGSRSVQDAQEQVEKATSKLQEAHARVGAAASESRQKQLEATKGMTPAVTGFFATLKQFASQWSAVGKAAQDQMLPKISEAMQKLQPLIKPLSEFAGKVGSLFGDFAIKAANALTGPWWKQWGTDMGPKILDVLKKLGDTTGNVISGVAGIAQAFMPLGQNMAGGLQNGSKAFADWAKNLKDNPSFKAFIDYVKDNAPKIGTILKDAFTFIGKFFEAGKGSGSSMLDQIKSGFDALAKIDVDKLRKDIESFANAVLTTIKFLKDWGPAIATVVAGIIGLRVVMTALQPIILLVRGAMWLFSSSATGAAGGASRFSSMLTTLRGGLSSVLSGARSLVTNGLNVLRTGLGALRTVMSALQSGAVTLLTRGLGLLRTGITVATNAFRVLSLALRANPIGLVITAVAALAAGLVWFFTKTETGRKAWNAIVDAFKTGVKWITDNWHKPFDAIGNFFSKTLPKMKDDAVKVIGDLLGAAAKKIGDVGAWAKKTFIDPFGKAWEKIKGIFDWKAIFKDFNIEKIIKSLPGGGTSIKILKGLHLMNEGGVVPEAPHHMGSLLPRYAAGGYITGEYLGPRADNVLAVNNAGSPVARVNPGEFILPVMAVMALVRRFGVGMLERLRTFDTHGDLGVAAPGFAGGGYVPSTTVAPTQVSVKEIFSHSALPRYAFGGPVSTLNIGPTASGGGSSSEALDARFASLERTVIAMGQDIASRDIKLVVNNREMGSIVQEASRNYIRSNR